MMTNTFDFYIYPREADASKRLSLQNIGAFILDESDHELIAPEGMGDDYPVKNGCIQYQSDMNTKWWDRLNEGWRQ